jgi:hypothetical protein
MSSADLARLCSAEAEARSAVGIFSLGWTLNSLKKNQES